MELGITERAEKPGCLGVTNYLVQHPIIEVIKGRRS